MSDPRHRRLGVAGLARLDDHQIEPERQPRDRFAVGEHAAIQETKGRRADPSPLAVIDGLLRQTERTADPPADLHDHQRGWRTRVDRHKVKLVATDMDIPGQEGPPDRREMGPDELFGGVTRALRRGPSRLGRKIFHACIVTRVAYRPRIGPRS